MMRLRGLVLFLLCLAGGARRSVRISGTQDRGAGVVVRRDEPAELPVDAAMLAEALDGMHGMLEELTGSPTKLQRWLSDTVQDLAKEHPEVATLMTDKDRLGPMRELLNGVKHLVEQQQELLREPQEARAAAAKMTDVLAKATDLVRLVQRAMVEPDLQQDEKINARGILEVFAPKAEGFQAPGAVGGPSGSAMKTKSAARTVPATMQDGADMQDVPAMQDLKKLAKDLNPVVGYWDPLGLSEKNFWDQSQASTIGFLRHSEIKHGRVAMAAFVGYILQANGVHWPWKSTGSGLTYDDIAAAGGPADQWDALPFAAKMQIIWFVGFLEIWSENNYILASSGLKHYMRGGKPGKFPSLKKELPHPIPFELFDPFGFQKDRSDEWKSEKLLAEINNGRLAMLGIMAFLAESKIPGAVPALGSLGIKPYSGEVMSPFINGETPMLPPLTGGWNLGPWKR